MSKEDTTLTHEELSKGIIKNNKVKPHYFQKLGHESRRLAYFPFGLLKLRVLGQSSEGKMQEHNTRPLNNIACEDSGQSWQKD